MAINWKKIKKIEFQTLKRACVTHDIDNCRRRFDMGGKRQTWVGFGFIDEGELQGNEILVYDKED